MSTPTTPCADCGTPRSVRSISVLGVEKTITLACPQCSEDHEVKARTRNLGALLALVEESSIKDNESGEWTIDTHPDLEARKVAKSYLSQAPSPLESLLAMRDWTTAGPDEKALLRGAQRNAMRGFPGIAFIGKAGRGKSGIASAIHREMRARGIPGCQVNVALLFDEMRARYQRDSSLGTVEQLLAPLCMTPLLTLDDIDKLHIKASGSNDEMLKLYRIVQRRIADQMPIMITSNTNLRDLSAKFDSFGEDGAAVMDRLAKTTPHSVTLKSLVSFRRVSGAA